MKIVAIKDMAAGNGEVGEMWQETKIFNPEDPISKIIDWVRLESTFHGSLYSAKRITITVPREDQ